MKLFLALILVASFTFAAAIPTIVCYDSEKKMSISPDKDKKGYLVNLSGKKVYELEDFYVTYNKKESDKKDKVILDEFDGNGMTVEVTIPQNFEDKDEFTVKVKMDYNDIDQWTETETFTHCRVK